MSRQADHFQLIWGIALTAAGIGVLFRIPQVVPDLAQIPSLAGSLSFVYFSFYLMAALLIAGGLRKIVRHFRRPKRGETDAETR